MAPGMLLLGYVKARLDKDETGDLKKFVLDFLKASDFNIEDVVLHEEEELITPELEQLIQNAPIDNEAKEEMFRKGKITNTELTFKHKAGITQERLAELVDIRDVVIDKSLPLEDRVKSYVEQIKDPYCFKVGDVVVRVSYADKDKSLTDSFTSMIASM